MGQAIRNQSPFRGHVQAMSHPGQYPDEEACTANFGLPSILPGVTQASTQGRSAAAALSSIPSQQTILPLGGSSANTSTAGISNGPLLPLLPVRDCERGGQAPWQLDEEDAALATERVSSQQRVPTGGDLDLDTEYSGMPGDPEASWA